MNLQIVAEWKLPRPSGYLHAAHVKLKDRETMLFVYSDKGGVDPGEECFWPKNAGRMHLTLFEMDGRMIWDRELPEGVLSGVWWIPVVPMDMDEDGEDEIYLINNHIGAPFSLIHRVLERWDAKTGECTGSIPWPINNFDERMSLCYRWYIVGGYAHGHPVLVTCQGTYGAMNLQGWNNNFEKRWELTIAADDPGPRASHVTPIMDMNGDGVDELFWGERIISFDTGKELFDYAPEYNGHSDAIIPFMDYNTGEMFLYTNREGGDAPGQFRVVTFRMNGERVWQRIPDTGHIHKGWVATVGDHYEKVAMAMSQHPNFNNPGLQDDVDGVYYYNAFTGEDSDYSLPVDGRDLTPIDFNGDGWSEFIAFEGPHRGDVFDRHGNLLCHVNGIDRINVGKLLDGLAGEQIMSLSGDRVFILADPEAKDGEIIKRRYSTPYLPYMQKKMSATGYNNYAPASI